jgi:hypothetical protein
MTHTLYGTRAMLKSEWLFRHYSMQLVTSSFRQIDEMAFPDAIHGLSPKQHVRGQRLEYNLLDRPRMGLRAPHGDAISFILAYWLQCRWNRWWQYKPFDEARKAFLASMDEELQNIQMEHDIQITKVMRDLWESKGVWYWECLISVNGWLFIIEDHILPKFSAVKGLVENPKQMSFFGQEDAGSLIKRKIADEETYKAELRSLFENSKP